MILLKFNTSLIKCVEKLEKLTPMKLLRSLIIKLLGLQDTQNSILHCSLLNFVHFNFFNLLFSAHFNILLVITLDLHISDSLDLLQMTLLNSILTLIPLESIGLVKKTQDSLACKNGSKSFILSIKANPKQSVPLLKVDVWKRTFWLNSDDGTFDLWGRSKVLLADLK